MSGCSSGTECPNCGKEANLYEDWKPVSYSNIQCLECGCFIQPAIFWLDLEELNDHRRMAELEPLTEEEFQKIEREFDYFVEG
jgi:transcription initiation factor TFIIIB Brf1 subunit/transcription initiation factor TFIIB